MEETAIKRYLRRVVEHIPADWLNLTTHRLDIYNEPMAKTQFLERFDALFAAQNADAEALEALPTAFDYIRLGHPLSCVLEWAVARNHGLAAESVIGFASRSAPLMAVLRTDRLAGRSTLIAHAGQLPPFLDLDLLRRVYGFRFEAVPVAGPDAIPSHAGRTIYLAEPDDVTHFELDPRIDFAVNLHPHWGSIIVVNGEENAAYVPDIQHFRRRETIAMTPANCRLALEGIVHGGAPSRDEREAENERAVLGAIREITGAAATALVGSSGLSVQYAIVMGLVDHALRHHPGKPIRLVIPPNCYGGTNDQARRVAATRDDIEVVDLPVDRGRDMVRGTDAILDQLAAEDAVPLVIAEIPTNPRVEVPDLGRLRDALTQERHTPGGNRAVEPVFILDQTFCPNVRFMGEGDVLAPVRTVAYVSGSKFPSGGRCTAGYCVVNGRGARLLETIERHLRLCDNRASAHQLAVLAEQLPSMLERIQAAYVNARDFVRFIRDVLPEAKINFVSDELAAQGFTPSVFSLDLPAKGETEEEREANKRAANLELIYSMIRELPGESKFCVSYGQLAGCYWTVPATSTQGTTKEGDKDYIVRVAVSPRLDLERHKAVFSSFARSR
ncbi:MAG: cystathionine beta-synthase [Myxococcota bacterium]